VPSLDAGEAPRRSTSSIEAIKVLRFLLAVTLFIAMGTAMAQDYAAGQVWTYHTRPGENESTLQINKIEQDPKLGPIFHISVFGVHLSSPSFAVQLAADLPHLPVSKKTLDQSVVAISSNPFRAIDYEPGYAQWRKAFDSGHAGIYTITIAALLSLAQKSMAQGPNDTSSVDQGEGR